MKLPFSALCLLLSLSFVTADTLEFRDGTLLDGIYQGGTSGTIRFESSGKLEVYPVTSVLALTISQRGEGSAQKTAKASPPPQSVAAPLPAGTHIVPAGSDVIIQLRSEISTASARSGQKFDAILENDLRAGSVIIAPKGSIVRGTIADVRRPRRIVKVALLSLTLDDVLVANQSIRLTTRTLTMQTQSDGSIIRGAVAGAIIGEVVDDDSGHGAAAGATLGALKRGDHIAYPAGSILKFALSTPTVISP